MKLDCIEEGSKWHIVDYDNNRKLIVAAGDVEGAWYKAAMYLEKMINDAKGKLAT